MSEKRYSEREIEELKAHLDNYFANSFLTIHAQAVIQEFIMYLSSLSQETECACAGKEKGKVHTPELCTKSQETEERISAQSLANREFRKKLLGYTQEAKTQETEECKHKYKDGFPAFVHEQEGSTYSLCGKFVDKDDEYPPKPSPHLDRKIEPLDGFDSITIESDGQAVKVVSAQGGIELGKKIQELIKAVNQLQEERECR